jgi:isopentenyl diphosphate isomerase/L-lactate dehydrogenase-like FMN-dependent dehydrogenase
VNGGRVSAFDSVPAARRRARRILPRAVFDFVDGGSDDEVTVEANRRAFRSIALRPQMASAFLKPNLATSVVGQPISMPILTAPCGFLRVVHPDGECGVARAAAAEGTVSIVSAMAGTSLEAVAAAAPADAKPWFQLYALGGIAGARQLVERARAAGYRALVVTVDTPVPGNRERDVRHRVPMPLSVNLRSAARLGPSMVVHPRWLGRFVRDGLPVRLPNTAGLRVGGKHLTQHEATMLMVTDPPTWREIAAIREQWSGPFLVKGILTSDDARRCLDVGADGIIVSNHGGRQLDTVVASLDALREVIDAVDGRADVLVDGGVQRGTDVVKALALGAQAVLIGRAHVWGLAAQGERGVSQILRILRSELVRDLRLMGRPDITTLDRSLIQTDHHRREVRP